MSKVRIPLIYIAGPYTVPDPVTNCRNALATAEKLLTLGYCPVVPHLSLFWDLCYKHSYDEWLELDLQYLLRCDALLRIPGESAGADKEVEFARIHDITICYSIEELLEASEL